MKEIENQKLVYDIVHKKFKNYINTIGFDDLVQTGIVGLIKAEQKYNPEIGKFSTYAYHCIKNEIIRFVRQETRVVNKSKKSILHDDNQADFNDIYQHVEQKLSKKEQEYLKDYCFNNKKYNSKMMSRIRQKLKKPYEKNITL